MSSPAPPLLLAIATTHADVEWLRWLRATQMMASHLVQLDWDIFSAHLSIKTDCRVWSFYNNPGLSWLHSGQCTAVDSGDHNKTLHFLFLSDLISSLCYLTGIDISAECLWCLRWLYSGGTRITWHDLVLSIATTPTTIAPNTTTTTTINTFLTPPHCLVLGLDLSSIVWTVNWYHYWYKTHHTITLWHYLGNT